MRPLLTVVLVLASTLAAAQTPSASASAASGTPVLRGQMSDVVAPVQPSGPPPSDVIPPAPANPAPPGEQSSLVGQQPQASGQWVYTQQYGWVWMPYGDAYTYVPPSGDAPNMYLYYPSVGWCWVVAPWLWGWGPSPYFGIYGTVGYGWYGGGFGRWYGYAGPYAGFYGRGYWYGGRWYGYHGAGAYHPAGPRGGGYVPPGGAAAHSGGFSAPHGGGMSGGHGGGGHR
jgi:hypothetical protein